MAGEEGKKKSKKAKNKQQGGIEANAAPEPIAEPLIENARDTGNETTKLKKKKSKNSETATEIQQAPLLAVKVTKKVKKSKIAEASAPSIPNDNGTANEDVDAAETKTKKKRKRSEAAELVADTEARSTDIKLKKKKQKKVKDAEQNTETQPLEALVEPQETKFTSNPSGADIASDSKMKKTKKAKKSIQPSEVENAEIPKKTVTEDQQEVPKKKSEKQAIEGEDPVDVPDVTAKKTKKSKKSKKSDVQPELAEPSKEDDKAETIKEAEKVVQEIAVHDAEEAGKVEAGLEAEIAATDNTTTLVSPATTRGGTAAKAFQRVKAEEWLNKKAAKDNSYAGTFGGAGWGAKAQEVLGKVRGKDFRHEKTKKKRGSYRGGVIDSGINSFKFESDEE